MTDLRSGPLKVYLPPDTKITYKLPDTLELTEEQLEVAARELCRLRGKDPDEKVSNEPEPSLAWVLAKKEIERMYEIQRALFHGLTHGKLA